MAALEEAMKDLKEERTEIGIGSGRKSSAKKARRRSLLIYMLYFSVFLDIHRDFVAKVIFFSIFAQIFFVNLF